MRRVERRAVGAGTAPAGAGEDRLSAVIAAVLVGANVVGGGLLGLLKVLHVPPIVASQPGPDEPALVRRDSGHPILPVPRWSGPKARDVARLNPADRTRPHR